MERYFIVTEESTLHKDWFDYKKNSSEVREMMKIFFESNGIETSEYYVTNDEIYIVPTEKDKEAFGSVLCSPINYGLQKFRTTSKIGKSWVQTLKDEGFKVLQKPRLIFYIRSISGKYRSRLFDQNGNVYCSIDPSGDKIQNGFIEMKASEFFKVIEESQEVAS